MASGRFAPAGCDWQLGGHWLRWLNFEQCPNTITARARLRISRDCFCPLVGRSAVSWLRRRELARAETLSADSVSGVHVSQGR